MQEICPYHIAKYVQWYLSDQKKRCKWDELCQCDMQFKSKDGTNKTEEFCENNWLIRDDAQKAIKIYMKNMRTLKYNADLPEDDEQGTERRCQCG